MTTLNLWLGVVPSNPEFWPPLEAPAIRTPAVKAPMTDFSSLKYWAEVWSLCSTLHATYFLCPLLSLSQTNVVGKALTFPTNMVGGAPTKPLPFP